MTDAVRSDGLSGSWRRLGAEQRVAAVGAVLLAVSTFGPFSFVELAQLLVAAAVLALLRARAQRREFHLPFGDGTVVAAAGLWAALLVAVRLFDRPLGQSLLALACAAIVVAAGIRERAKRPPDDLPHPAPGHGEEGAILAPRGPDPEAPTERLAADAGDQPAIREPRPGE